MNLKIKKIDAIIVIALIIIAGIIIYKVDYIPDEKKKETPIIEFFQDVGNNKLIVKSVSKVVLWEELDITGRCNAPDPDQYVVTNDEIINCEGTITITYIPTNKLLGTWTFEKKMQLPISLPTEAWFNRGVSPEDEGEHISKIGINREWWYYTVVFDEDSDLPGWTATIGFNHMAMGGILGFLKPDLLTVTLHGPNGEEYGGMINKARGGGIIWQPTLQMAKPGVDLKYEDSWAEGEAPNWHVHAEDNEIDKDHKIVIDLDYFAPNPAIWIHSNRIFMKGRGKMATYIFTACEVEGTVKIDGEVYDVKGVGHHEHSWSDGIFKLFVKGWDWCHFTLENGWNLYYSNYYLTPQFSSTRTYKVNPVATLMITTDRGETLTQLNDVEISIEKSDKISLFLNKPLKIAINAKPSISQGILRTYYLKLNFDIEVGETYDKKFGSLKSSGMSIGQCNINGKVTWSDNDGNHEVDLNGIGSIWTMRSSIVIQSST